MGIPLPMLQPTPVLKGKDYREVLIRELEAGKIPISLGKKCPVQCEFCYELDHSYRETLEPPKTTQEDWEFIRITLTRSRPIPCSSGVWVEMNTWSGPICSSIPRRWNGSKIF